MTLARTDFVGVFINALTGLGLSPEAALVNFPMELFLPGSDIEPIKKYRHEIYEGLTKWRPKSDSIESMTNRKIILQGKTHEDVLTKANNMFIANLWGDGLPLLPATDERVSL